MKHTKQDDLEERLRAQNIYLDGKWEHPSVCSEAADEIERLRKWDRLRQEDIMTLGQEVGKLTMLNAELVAALEDIAQDPPGLSTGRGEIARAALAKVNK